MRFAPVISSMKVNRYDVDDAIDSALRLTNKLLHFMSTFNDKKCVFRVRLSLYIISRKLQPIKKK